jgi:hypothetical protein
MSVNGASTNGHRHRERRTGIAFKSRARRPRSAITSGRELFIDGDSTSAWARLYHDLIIDYASDFGGVDQLTFRQFSTIQNAAALKCELLRLEACNPRACASTSRATATPPTSCGTCSNRWTALVSGRRRTTRRRHWDRSCAKASTANASKIGHDRSART